MVNRQIVVLISVLPISCNPNEYFGPFPNFREPSIVGSFSVDGDRQFNNDLSGLQYLDKTYHKLQQPMKVELDLDHNVSKAITALPIKDTEKITHLLRGILAFKQKFAVNEELDSLHTDIVCFRGLLATIMGTPYERKDDWMVDVVRWKGTIYIIQIPTERRIRENERQTDRQKQMSSWGYKFEQLVTTTVPGGRSDPQEIVNENEEFCCMFRTRINGLSLVYGAEMDAYSSDQTITSPGSLRPGNFTELKTSRQIEHERQDNNFRRFKLLKWWAQSFLVGTPTILCGWRDDDGVVASVEPFNVKDIPKVGVGWKPTVCFNFLATFLQTLKSTITSDNVSTVHRVYFDPRCRQLEMTKLLNQDTEALLPQWYLNSVFSQ